MACVLLGCRGGSKEGGSASGKSEVREPTQAESLPPIVLDEAPGVKPGIKIVARGIEIGSVESTKLDRQRVVLGARLDPGHELELRPGACVRARVHGEALSLELELGEGEGEAPARLEACAGEGRGADPPRDPAPGDPDPGPDPVEEMDGETGADDKEAEPEASRSKSNKRKPKRRSHCGDKIFFSTLSVSAVDPVPIHLPKGGWRAKIRFENEGAGFVEIDGVSSAAFMDKSGAALPVASMPGSGDWFMPFQLPPHSSKVVRVTFHDKGGGKPWVHRIKYTWSCS